MVKRSVMQITECRICKSGRGRNDGMISGSPSGQAFWLVGVQPSISAVRGFLETRRIRRRVSRSRRPRTGTARRIVSRSSQWSRGVVSWVDLVDALPPRLIVRCSREGVARSRCCRGDVGFDQGRKRALLVVVIAVAPATHAEFLALGRQLIVSAHPTLDYGCRFQFLRRVMPSAFDRCALIEI